MSAPTINEAETQAASDLREMEMVIEYYGGSITRHIEIIDPNTKIEDLMKLIRADEDGACIGDVFTKSGTITKQVGDEVIVIAKFWTVDRERYACGEVYRFYDSETEEELD